MIDNDFCISYGSFFVCGDQVVEAVGEVIQRDLLSVSKGFNQLA